VNMSLVVPDSAAPLGFRAGVPLFRSVLLVLVLLVFQARAGAADRPVLGTRAAKLMAQTAPRLQEELTRKGFRLGTPLFIRIFKLDSTLEVWLQKEGSFQLFKTYPICSYSGYPGPKLYEGDWQSPEGFYTVGPEQLNPRSQYHLSFDIGYPNGYDRARKRTGSSIMVHGGCSSRGCFAMTDHWIEEIFLLAYSALNSGQERFSVHIFPFPLTAENLAKFGSSPWIGFWKNLQEGYAAFEQTHQPPVITAKNGRYLVQSRIRLAMARKRDNQAVTRKR